MLDQVNAGVARIVANCQGWLSHLSADPELIESSRHKIRDSDFVAWRAQEVAGRFGP
ncbi:hypothetical protein [Pseudomonas putida]|uniref:hypothetical protein n=1 Tax=Pseudomonas putida TaxID=303 RepID=UPI001576ADE9|nr:hypothetical protein [Pseudomonas putida]